MRMESTIRLINVEDIIPNRFQPRLEFDNDSLNELATSIRAHGIVQPLVLRRVSNKYEIIAGERRYKAATMIGLNQVPAIIADLDDNESAEVAVVENIMRKNLSCIEEARSYKKLLDKNYVTQEQLAERLGTSQSNIANKIRLLSLDENVQDALLKEKISERHARSLLKITDKKIQVDLLNKIIQERYTVKKLDEEIEKILNTYNKNNNNITGNITENKSDIDINNIIENAIDIEPVEKESEEYVYINKKTENAKKKDSIFFNNLENESVNMGFENSKNKEIIDDFDILDLTEEETDEEIIEDNDEALTVKKKEIYFEKPEDLLINIKDLIDQAKDVDIAADTEEFDFDNMYQIIIRVSKKK